MFRLAHISDIHLGPLPDVGYRDLVSKRITGYVNWHRNRRQFLHDSVIDAILDHLKAADPDHLAVTGDLVNLALDVEIEWPGNGWSWSGRRTTSRSCPAITTPMCPAPSTRSAAPGAAG